MSPERKKALDAALVKIQRDAEIMAAAYRRWDLGRYAAEVRELERAGHAAVLAALRDGVKK